MFAGVQGTVKSKFRLLSGRVRERGPAAGLRADPDGSQKWPGAAPVTCFLPALRTVVGCKGAVRLTDGRVFPVKYQFVTFLHEDVKKCRRQNVVFVLTAIFM